MFFTGAVMLIFGMGMFQLGADTAMSTIGEGIGVQLAKTKKNLAYGSYSHCNGYSHHNCRT